MENFVQEQAPSIHEQEYILKIVLIGDSNVGKSKLVMRFTKNKYQPETSQTIGNFLWNFILLRGFLMTK